MTETDLTLIQAAGNTGLPDLLRGIALGLTIWAAALVVERIAEKGRPR